MNTCERNFRFWSTEKKEYSEMSLQIYFPDRETNRPTVKTSLQQRWAAGWVPESPGRAELLGVESQRRWGERRLIPLTEALKLCFTTGLLVFNFCSKGDARRTARKQKDFQATDKLSFFTALKIPKGFPCQIFSNAAVKTLSPHQGSHHSESSRAETTDNGCSGSVRNHEIFVDCQFQGQ